MGDGLCKTCRHFAPRGAPYEHLGSCEIELPRWLLDCVDFKGIRSVRADDRCDLFRDKREGD